MAFSPYPNCFISTVAPVAEARVLRQVPPTAVLEVQVHMVAAVAVAVVHLLVARQVPVAVAVMVLL
jgi:limonene-1,2-epoxide hydrolase